MTAPRVLPAPHETEQQFCDKVIDLARLLKWTSAHFRPAMTVQGWRTAVSGDGKGFPDLLMTRRDRLIVAELKVGRNKVTADQLHWLDSFKAVGAEVFVWTPNDWDEITGELR